MVYCKVRLVKCPLSVFPHGDVIEYSQARIIQSALCCSYLFLLVTIWLKQKHKGRNTYMHIYFSIFKLLDRLAYRGIHYSLSRNGSLQWPVFINSGQPVMGAHPWKARSGGPIQQTSECSSVCQRTINTWAGPMSNGTKSKESDFVGTLGSSTLCIPWPGITFKR